MQDLLDRGAQALELLRRAGAEAAEVYVIDAPGDAVLLEPSSTGRGVNLKTAVTVPHRGLGLTARFGGAVGFSSSSDLSPEGLATVVEACRQAALPEDPPLPLTPPVTGAGAEKAPTPGPVVAGLIDRRLLEMNLPELVEVAREVAGEVLEAGAGVLGAVCLSTCRRVAVLNSLGLERSSLDTLLTAGTYAASPGGGLSGVSRAFRSLEGLRSHALGRRAAEQAKSCEGARDVTSGRQTVVLRPEAVMSLLATSLGPALGADRVSEGLSPFAGPDGRPRLGEEVTAAILSITDDAARPGGTGSYDFDAEGTCGGATPLIRDGRLVAILHNNRTAAAAGATTAAGPASASAPGAAASASTGNASRDRTDRMSTFVEPSGHFGYRAGISPSTLVVEAPGATYPSITEAGVDCGLLVADVLGAFVIDPAVGDFSVTTSSAWALEGGRPAYPVKRAMLTGNIYELLRRVIGLVEEPADVKGGFSVLTPSWVVADLTVV